MGQRGEGKEWTREGQGGSDAAIGRLPGAAAGCESECGLNDYKGVMCFTILGATARAHRTPAPSGQDEVTMRWGSSKGAKERGWVKGEGTTRGRVVATRYPLPRHPSLPFLSPPLPHESPQPYAIGADCLPRSHLHTASFLTLCLGADFSHSLFPSVPSPPSPPPSNSYCITHPSPAAACRMFYVCRLLVERAPHRPHPPPPQRVPPPPPPPPPA